MADPFKVEQLVINLLDNAIKYTNEGEITVGAESNGDMLTFTVTDTGPGIPKDDIPMIFSRFYRVDKSRSRELGGTGLGLSIVKNIVLLHNGDIKVESALGQGSTFIVRMPKKHK
jgi:signal transduction histidine kinase